MRRFAFSLALALLATSPLTQAQRTGAERPTATAVGQGFGDGLRPAPYDRDPRALPGFSTPGDPVFRRTNEADWRERSNEQPQSAEELDATPQPFYERFAAYIRQTTGKRVMGALPYSRVGVNNLKLSDAYQVNVGDEVEIQAWGTVNLNYNLVVDTSGRIFVPEIGSVQVQGVRGSELTPMLARQFGRVYKGVELRAMVSAARSVDLQISGQAQVVGLRSVPASYSVVGAALAFTRPAEGGSRRFIELRRGGTSQRIDLYCFTTGRCGELPTTLRNQDGLFVPARGKLVAVAGAVNRPGIYELADDEGLDRLLEYAGGMAIDSSTEPVDLYSFGTSQDGRARAYQSLQMSAFCRTASGEAGCRRLQDGDFLDLRPMMSTVKGMVTVTADGVDPLRLTFEPGMRLLDVIKQPLTRFLSKETIAGINRGDFKSINELDDRLPEIDLESVTIYRLKPDSRGYESVSVDALAALREGPQSAYNIAIEDGDILAMDTKSAWRSPRAGMTGSVRLLGEVKRPGRYRFTGVRKLSDLIQMSGGMTENAAPWSAVVLRNDDPRASVNRRAGIRALQSVFAYQARERALTLGAESSLPAAGGAAQVPAPTAPAGPIVLPRLAPELERLIGNRTMIYLDSQSLENVTLAPGDVVIIPPQQETIGCYGAVFRTGELTVSGTAVTPAQARDRCGVIHEMSPTIYQFNVRTGASCRETWHSSCPDLAPGDFIVAVPDAIRKRGIAAFLEYVEAVYKVALSAATLKVLSNN